RSPLGPPVRAVIGTRRGTGLPFLHLNRLNQGDTVVVLRERIHLVAVQVDPLDAVGVAAARRHHIHRRHRRLPHPLVPALSPPSPDGSVRTSSTDAGRLPVEHLTSAVC